MRLNDDKTLKRCMMEMTYGQFWAFMAGLDYGDGSQKMSMRRFHNVNIPLINQLQELLAKHGAKSNARVRQTYTTKRGVFREMMVLNYVPNHRSTQINQAGTKHSNVSLEEYGRSSWCVTVDNATLLIRRNGCVAVVGNSHRHRHFKCEFATRNKIGIGEITPGWQLKTPFTWKIPGGESNNSSVWWYPDPQGRPGALHRS